MRTAKKQDINFYRLGHICFVSVSADQHAVEEEPEKKPPFRLKIIVLYLSLTVLNLTLI